MRHMMSHLVCAAALAALMPLPLQAQESVPDGKLLGAITLADMKALVRAEGHDVATIVEIGPHSIQAKTATGMIFHLFGTLCDRPGSAPGCLGLMMQVIFDADPQKNGPKLNDANLAYAATKVYMMPNKQGKQTLYISRYLILDHGVTFKNLRSNLANTLSIAPKIVNDVFLKAK